MNLGSIIINSHNNRDGLRRVTTKSLFFKGEIIYKIAGGKITFLKPDIDYRGKSITAHQDKKTKWFLTSIACDVPPGKYKFDEEESNEDQLVMYYE